MLVDILFVVFVCCNAFGVELKEEELNLENRFSKMRNLGEILGK